MKTTLLDGVTPAKIDKQIMGNLLLNVSTPDEVRKEKLIIGIRNEEGDIYRLIGAMRHHNFMNAIEELQDLDLVDELQDCDDTQEGCDAIFREA